MNDDAEAFIQTEARVLAAARETLSAVVRELTPHNSALKSPLSATTQKDIAMCFGLLSAREHELRQLIDAPQTARPQYKNNTLSDNTATQEQAISLASLQAMLNKHKQTQNND